jgi:hypothetical protein
MAGIRWPQVIALTGIGANGLGAKTQHIALIDQKAHRLGAGLAAVVGVSGEVVRVRAVDPAAFTDLKPEGQT